MPEGPFSAPAVPAAPKEQPQPAPAAAEAHDAAEEEVEEGSMGEEEPNEDTRRREQAAHEEVTDMAYEAAGHAHSFAEAVEEEVRMGFARLLV
jgi:hypothetical protein